MPPSPILTHCRRLSLANIFSSRPTTPTSILSPYAVADVSRAETDANAHSHDVDKQLALFQAYGSVGRKEAWELTIARWERMCEFDPTSPLLQSDKAFEYYLHALSKTGQDASINPAVRRRDSLLAAHPPPPPSPEEPQVLTTVAPASTEPDAAVATSATSATPATTSQPTPNPSLTPDTPATSPFSRSQRIADSVLAGNEVEPLGKADAASNNSSLASVLGAGSGASGSPIHVVISEPKGAWLGKLGRGILLAGLSLFVVFSFFAYIIDSSGLVKAAPRQSEFEPSEATNPVKFSDVHGVDEAKEELRDVVAFLKDPSSFSALGGKLPKGVLLTGPPGTGKTMLARAVAGEAGVPFLFASGSEFDEMFVGVGAKRVRDLFAAARKKQPAIIFIDELDAVGGKRNARDQQYMKQTLNQLLVEMDGFQQAEGVIVIAATNFPESLDEALVRPGRFDRHIAVPLPDVRGRAQIIAHHMRDIVTSKDVDPTILARGTAGFSGADLQNMVNQAAIQASKERCADVNLKHMEWARDRIVMGAERRSMVVDDQVKKVTAYHEGGHALAALYTDGAMPLHKVTCMPRGHALGVTSMLPKDDRVSVSRKEYYAEIDVSLAGRVAEEMIFGEDNVTSGASSDLRAATATATRMIKNWGYSDKIGRVYLNDNVETISASKREEIESEVRRFLHDGEVRVKTLLQSRNVELHRLATALLEHETLTLDEVKKVIRGEKIRTISEVINDDLGRMAVSAAPATTVVSTEAQA